MVDRVPEGRESVLSDYPLWTLRCPCPTPDFDRRTALFIKLFTNKYIKIYILSAFPQCLIAA